MESSIAIVMGGGPSLLSDLERLTLYSKPIHISANEHGARFVKPDWVVCGDKHHQSTKELMRDRVRKVTDAPIITPHFVEGTTRLHNWARWGLPGNSGYQAILWARLLGYSKIFLCGFDLYQGDLTYATDKPGEPSSSSGKTKLLKVHTGNFHRYYCLLQPASIRAVSGPLGRLTGYWDAQEYLSDFEFPASQDYFNQVWRSVEITAKHDRCSLEGIRLPYGEVVQLTHWETRYVEERNLGRRVDTTVEKRDV